MSDYIFVLSVTKLVTMLDIIYSLLINASCTVYCVSLAFPHNKLDHFEVS